MITTQVTAGSRPCPNSHIYTCMYSSCKGETLFQQWRWTTSARSFSGTTAEQMYPFPVTTRKIEFGPRWDFQTHTLTRKNISEFTFLVEFRTQPLLQQKTKCWIVTNDHWMTKHMKTPPFTQTIHSQASCITKAGVVAILYSRSTRLSLFFDIIMLSLCLCVQLFHRSSPTHPGPRNKLFWEGKQMRGSTCQLQSLSQFLAASCFLHSSLQRIQLVSTNRRF